MRRKIRNKLLMLLDSVLICISVLSAYLLRFSDGGFWDINPIFRNEILHVIIAALILKLIGFYILKLYSSLWEYAGMHEAEYIVLASVLCNFLMQAYIFIMQLRVPRSIFIITMLTDVFLIGGARFAYRIFRRMIMGEMIRFSNARRILLVGGGDTGATVIQELKRHPELKSLPVAIIDSDYTKIGKSINGVPIVGNDDSIPSVIEKYDIDEVIVAVPSAGPSKVSRIFEMCSNASCKVKILPSVTQLIDESVMIQKIRDVSIEDLLQREPVVLDLEEISLYIKEKIILVTGGGGSIGSELCRQISSFGPRQLIILDNYENNAYDIQNELRTDYPKLDLKTVIANVRERTRLDSIFKEYRPDIVFHAAAHKHVPLMEENPTEAIKNNVFGTLNVAECADKYGVKRFVMISTDKAVNPTNVMGATKRIAEMIIQAMDKHSKTEYVAVRFGNVLGSNGSVIPLFRKQIEQGGPVTVTDPEIIRYFMTIPEAVQLVLQAGAMAEGGEIFVLDMGEPVKIYDLACNLIKLSGFEPEVDIKIEFTGLRPGEKLYEELLLEEEGIQATKNNKIFVAKPLRTDLAILKREIECLGNVILNHSDEAKEYIKVIVPNYRCANDK
jgi:FlaA1/EpsC-like NDP-sugar epimerase